MPREAKKKAIAGLAARAGVGHLRAAVLRGRPRQPPDPGKSAAILKGIAEAHDALQGIVRGRVTVARPIGDAERASIEEAVGARVGGKVKLAVDVDSAILAGFVARVASNVFDASAAAAIRRFREQAHLRTGA